MPATALPASLQTFPRMLGDWEGTLLFIDPQGAVQSRARIQVEARFVDGRWKQVNTITPEQGEQRTSIVTGSFDDKERFQLDTERVLGTGGEVLDQVVVTWHLKASPGSTFAELISFATHDQRVRTWHHFEEGRFVGSTLLQERRVQSLAG